MSWINLHRDILREFESFGGSVALDCFLMGFSVWSQEARNTRKREAYARNAVPGPSIPCRSCGAPIPRKSGGRGYGRQRLSCVGCTPTKKQTVHKGPTIPCRYCEVPLPKKFGKRCGGQRFVCDECKSALARARLEQFHEQRSQTRKASNASHDHQ